MRGRDDRPFLPFQSPGALVVVQRDHEKIAVRFRAVEIPDVSDVKRSKHPLARTTALPPELDPGLELDGAPVYRAGSFFIGRRTVFPTGRRFRGEPVVCRAPSTISSGLIVAVPRFITTTDAAYVAISAASTGRRPTRATNATTAATLSPAPVTSGHIASSPIPTRSPGLPVDTSMPGSPW